MKRQTVLLMLVSLAVAAGCESPPDSVDGPGTAASRAVDYDFPAQPLPPDPTVSLDQNRRLVAPKAVDGRVAAATTYTAGPLEVKIWSCNNWPPAAHPVVQCTVDPDYVVVGGGAWATWSGAGALLTASFPADPSVLRTWEGRSKDHGVSEPHVLITYAIGLKISGVSRSTLLGNAFVNRHTSAPSPRPNASAPFFPNSILQTGDGCLDDWRGPGNMLTGCESITGASGKEHGWPDAAAITHYRIGINRVIPGVGELENDQVNGFSGFGGGSLEARMTHTAGWVPAGIGAADTAGSFPPGRLLTRMTPFTEFTNQAAGASKDHLLPATATVTARLFMLRKLP